MLTIAYNKARFGLTIKVKSVYVPMQLFIMYWSATTILF